MSAAKSTELMELASIKEIKESRVCRCGKAKMAGMATCLKCWHVLSADLRDRLCLRPGPEYAAAYKEACKALKEMP